MSPEPATAARCRNALLCEVAGLTLALPLEAVREVLPLPALMPPTGMPPFVAGAFLFDGRAVTVVRLDRLLGLAGREPGLYAPLILLNGDDGLALLAERASAVAPVAADAVTALADAGTFNGCVGATLALAAGPVPLLEPARLLLAGERQACEAFRAQAERRLAELAADAS